MVGDGLDNLLGVLGNSVVIVVVENLLERGAAFERIGSEGGGAASSGAGGVCEERFPRGDGHRVGPIVEGVTLARHGRRLATMIRG